MQKARVAIAGCGKAAEHYASHLRQSQAVDLVAVSDPVADRADHFARTYTIEHAFQDADEMLDALDFDLLVNLTPMLLHASVNRKALEAGRNVWCEKPIATDLAEAQALLFLAQRQGVGLWSAPAHYISSSFQFMASMLTAGSIGRPSAAHGIIGSSGPAWPGSAWFYREGGGSLFDVGVYAVSLFIGLLGPAQNVTAMAGTAMAQRIINGEIIDVEADDTDALILDHGKAVYSVIQSGFVYAALRQEWTVQITGTEGAITMGGYAWEPGEVSIYHGDQTKAPGQWEIFQQGTYAWQSGATYIAECLAKGEQPIVSGEHAVHVLEVMQAALRSARTGQRVQIASTFPWPVRKQDGGKPGRTRDQIS